jgi:prevent-host-death family protein
MKKLTVRQLRTALPRIAELVETEGEILITRHGRTVARVVPARTPGTPPSHADLRAAMKPLATGSEALLRRDRDER